jgi:hypothetical protein
VWRETGDINTVVDWLIEMTMENVPLDTVADRYTQVV